MGDENWRLSLLLHNSVPRMSSCGLWLFMKAHPTRFLKHVHTDQRHGAGTRNVDRDPKITEAPLRSWFHLRFIIQPMDIPVATPIAIPVAMPIENVAITVSTGCRCRRLIVSSMSSSAVSPPCFTMRRVAPKLSSSASARAAVAREACRAASVTLSPVHSATDCAMIY